MAVKWKPAKTAPDEAFGLVVYGTVTCSCGHGSKVMLVGGRINGEWVLDFDHSLEITHWMKLPEPPDMRH